MLRVRIPPSRAPERRYVIDLVLRHWLGQDYELTEEQDAEGTTIENGVGTVWLRDGLFGLSDRDWLTPGSIPDEPRTVVDIPPEHRDVLVASWLPILREECFDDGTWFADEGRKTSVAADLLGMVFFLVTRYEEVASVDVDKHDRFPAESSFLVRTGTLERPLADECTELLWSILKRRCGLTRRRKWKYQVEPSHDVDRPVRLANKTGTWALREFIGKGVVERSPRKAVRVARAWMRTRQGGFMHDPYFTFPFLMEASESRNLTSAFYFLAGRTEPRIDADYEMDTDYIKHLLNDIRQRGHLAGIHPSYRTHRDPDILRKEADVMRAARMRAGFGDEPFGGRQHYLRWNAPDTWRHYVTAGLSYDTTLGFAGRAGFRCGTSRPYPAFDLVERQCLDLEERPLIIMDVTLLRRMALGRAEILSLVDRLARRTARYGGSFSILWHNSTLRTPDSRQLYLDVLDTALQAGMNEEGSQADATSE